MLYLASTGGASIVGAGVDILIFRFSRVVTDNWGGRGGPPPITLDQSLWKCCIKISSSAKISKSKNKA